VVEPTRRGYRGAKSPEVEKPLGWAETGWPSSSLSCVALVRRLSRPPAEHTPAQQNGIWAGCRGYCCSVHTTQTGSETNSQSKLQIDPTARGICLFRCFLYLFFGPSLDTPATPAAGGRQGSEGTASRGAQEGARDSVAGRGQGTFSYLFSTISDWDQPRQLELQVHKRLSWSQIAPSDRTPGRKG